MAFAMDWLAVFERLTDDHLDVTAPFPWQSNPSGLSLIWSAG